MDGRQPNPRRTRPPSRMESDAGGPVGASFVARVTPHLPAVLRAAAALVGMADAEDAAQEAIVRAWQAAPSLRDEGAFRDWLLRITVNLCRDWHRGRFGTRWRLDEPLEESDDEDTRVAAISGNPGTSDHTGALDLRRAVNALDRDLRTVVALRYYADMDATEVGAALGVPAATVRTRLRRALALLREALSTPEELPGARAWEGDR